MSKLLAKSALGLALLWVGANLASGQEMRDLHNAYRSKHCVPAVAWSAQLATAAQQYASKCTTDPSNPGRFAHSARESRPNQGENLAWGTGEFSSAKSSVDRWYNEISQYNFAAPGYNSATGHFTQVIWRATTQIGCGSATCSGQTLWVCRYSPAGNITSPAGQFASNVPKTCSPVPQPTGTSIQACRDCQTNCAKKRALCDRLGSGGCADRYQSCRRTCLYRFCMRR
jgi:hypothetical protein